MTDERTTDAERVAADDREAGRAALAVVMDEACSNLAQTAEMVCEFAAKEQSDAR